MGGYGAGQADVTNRAHVRTCRCMYPRVSYLWNGSTDYTGIWCVVRDQLARCFIQVRGGVHISTCARAYLFSRISGTAGGIVLVFGVLYKNVFASVFREAAV